MPNIKTIRLHFWLPFLILLAFTLLLISFSVQQYRDFHDNLEKTTISFLKEQLTQEANRIERLNESHLETMVHMEISDLVLRNDVKTVAFIDDKGIVINGSQIDCKGKSFKRCHPEFNETTFRTTQQKYCQQIEISKDRNTINVYEPIMLPIKQNEIRPTRIGILFAEINLSDIKSEHLTSLLIQSYFAWGIGLLLVVLLYIVLYYWLTFPFKTLISMMNKVGNGDYTARTKFIGKGEFFEIGNAFNNMADEIQSNRDQLQIILEQEKKLQLDLQIAKQKAEESDKLKSAFLANMSHEIRTPMNGILGFADLLKTPNLSKEEQDKYIQVIETSGQRMLNIINDIIDISKVESGLMKVMIVPSNINNQIDFIYTFFKLEIEQRGLHLEYKKGLPFEESIVNTDHEKVYAILMNLVKNAIKYSKKGTIEFGYELKFVSFGNEPALKSELEFFVKDTGIGIPQNRQTAIFERFIQADILDRNAIQGAGLGLAIAKAYVEMLGGRIWVKSEENIGSTFYFTIPYNYVKNAINDNNETIQQQPIPMKDLNVLIAEDDDTSGMLLTLALEKYCKEVTYVSNGEDAVKMCRNNPTFDLILMDIKMPKLNGYEAIKQIRTFNKEVIIIAQTAFGLAGDREKAIEAGSNNHISKPIIQKDLISLIEKYFKADMS